MTWLDDDLVLLDLADLADDVVNGPERLTGARVT